MKALVIVIGVAYCAMLLYAGHSAKISADKLQDKLCATGRHPDFCVPHGWIF